MTDIFTAAPTTIRRFNLPRPSLPRLAVGASLTAIFGVMADAINLAYVAPYASIRRQPQSAPDDDLDGRDPSW